jgi:host factor-I protein
MKADRMENLVSRSVMQVLQEKDRQMENKPAQNIQDSFLNTARKEKTQVTIYLLSGVKLTGRIRSFDKYSVVLETNNQEQLIFKHAISTVVMSRGSYHGENRTAQPPSAEVETAAKTEG